MGARWSLERGTAEEISHKEIQGDCPEPSDAGRTACRKQGSPLQPTATLITSPAQTPHTQP